MARASLHALFQTHCLSINVSLHVNFDFLPAGHQHRYTLSHALSGKCMNCERFGFTCIIVYMYTDVHLHV